MKKLLPILILIIVSGCARVPAPQAPFNQRLSWQARQEQLQQIQNYRAQGLIGVRQGQQAESANVDLTQTGQQYHMEIFGPLGADRVILDGQPGKVTMKTSDGKIFHAKTPEALLQQQLGWSLPVANMYYWLRGLPAPNFPKIMAFDQYHHLVKLTQQGWHIEYQRYAGIEHYDLPTKILLINEDLHVRIIVSQIVISDN